jgi:small nuclear ribonucleoprotein B and B'
MISLTSRNDGRALVGQMLAYDKHMNFVLAECEEFRTVKVSLYYFCRIKRSIADGQGKKTKEASTTDAAPSVQQKRTLGLVILRGESIVSVTVEGPPPATSESTGGLTAGPGKGVPAGRGMPLGAGESLTTELRAFAWLHGSDADNRRTSYGCPSYGLCSTSSRIPTWYARSTTRNASWIPRFPSPRNAPRVSYLLVSDRPQLTGQSTPTWIPPTSWIPRSYAFPSWSDAPWVSSCLAHPKTKS